MKIANAKTFGGERYLVESDIEGYVLSSDVALAIQNAIESTVVNVNVDSSIMSDGLNPVAGSAIYAALGEKVGVSEFEALAGSVVSSAVGKQLSEEDFTSELKDKLVSIESGATRVVDSTVAGWGYTKITSANVSTIVNGILPNGIMTSSVFASGEGVVKSAVNATNAANAGNATTVNGHTVSKNVPSDAVFTDTIPGSATITINGAGSELGSFTADAKSPVTISIPQATSTVYGLAKVETAVANTSNAVANSVVSAISSTMNAHIGSDAVHVPATGTTGHYLKKTANGTEWAEVAQTIVDSTMQSNGMNPVAGSAMYSALASKVDIVDLAHVAFTGNYNDLTNIPETFQITIDSTVEQNGVNAVAGSAVYAHVSNAIASIPEGTSTTLGLARVEQVVSNTSNAVANKVVSAISSTVNSHVTNSLVHVPSGGTDGQVLKMVGNTVSWGTDLTVGGSAVLPTYSAGDANKILQVKANGEGTEWVAKPTIGSALVKVQAGGQDIASFGLNDTGADKIVNISSATSTKFGVVKLETVVSNTFNAVANSVVYGISGTLSTVSGRVDILSAAVEAISSNSVVSDDLSSALASKVDIVDLAHVAFTGNYNDLTNIPEVANITLDSTVAQNGANAVAGSAIYSHVSNAVGSIPHATSTVYGLAKVETVVSNTSNAVANSVVSGISSTMNAHITSSALHVPTFSAGDSGKVLRMNAAGTSAVWSAMPTIPTVGSAVIKISAGDVLVDSFSVNATSSKSINIPMATSTVAGVVKIDSTIANTSNAVANSAVYLMSSSFNAQLANIPDGFEKVSMLPTMNAGTVGKLYFVTTENKFYVGTASGNPTADLIGHFSPDYVGDGINNHTFAYQSGTGDSRRWSVMESAAGTDLGYNSESGQWRITTLFWDSPYDEGTSYYYATAPSGSNPWDAGLQWRLYGNGTDIALNGSTNYFENNSMSYGYANVGGGDGDMARSDFVTGNSSVASAGNATTVNGHTVSANVPANAVFTDTIPGSAVITLKAGGSTVGSFSVNATSNTSVSIPSATSTVYGVAKVETVVSNTSNAVANSVVYSLSGIVSNVSSSVNVLTQTIGTLGTSYATVEHVSSAIASKVDIVDLSHVAFTGSYEDLTDKPTALAGGWNWHSMTIPSTSSSYSLTVNVEKKVNGVWSSVDVNGRVKYWTGTDFVALTSAGLPATLAGYKAFVLLGDIVARDTECRSNWHIVGHGTNDDSDWQGFIW